MITSTLSAKNQTTLSVDILRKLHLRAGARFVQSVENGRIVLQPIGSASTAFGSLRSKRKGASAKKEKQALSGGGIRSKRK